MRTGVTTTQLRDIARRAGATTSDGLATTERSQVVVQIEGNRERGAAKTSLSQEPL